jgi:hypothetical protein
MKKQGERDLVRSLPFIQVGLANGLGKLFSNISKSDLPNDTSNPLDMERTRPHAIPESDGQSILSLNNVELENVANQEKCIANNQS